MEKINLQPEDLGPEFSRGEGFENNEFSSENTEYQTEEFDLDSEDFDDYESDISEKKNTKEKPKFYHVTDRHYNIGDVIEGRSGNDKFENVIFLTDSPKPHMTLSEREFKNAFIYKVVPLSGVKGGRHWDELAAKKVKVAERLGSAKGFFNKGDFSSVKLRNFDDSVHKRMSENYKSGKSENIAGKELLKKIEKKYDKK